MPKNQLLTPTNKKLIAGSAKASQKVESLHQKFLTATNELNEKFTPAREEKWNNYEESGYFKDADFRSYVVAAEKLHKQNKKILALDLMLTKARQEEDELYYKLSDYGLL